MLDTQKMIVGIGSSAGGLEALSLVVSNLPKDLGCSYVVVQHLSPNYKSMLTEILSRESSIPVKEVVSDEEPEADTVYVVPPNFNIVYKEGKFRLLTPSKEIFTKPSVNLFFQSIAEECGENSIGIILSGTGSDGTSGLRAIKAAGGVALVQEPNSAKYSGMPQSAIDAGVADRLVMPENIGSELKRLVKTPELFNDEPSKSAISEMKQLIEKVRRQTKIDFSGYKPATLLRRIHRRMSATDSNTLAEYLEYTDKSPKELELLAKDTLISVTSFFRDKDVFTPLRKHLGALLEKKVAGDEIRVWVAGCATGEEAYSLAILISELLGERIDDFKVQVFATDIDGNALNVARKGIYPSASMSELTSEQVERFFKNTEMGFEVTKQLRELVVFARQDLAVDPPFLKLDMVTCRNVLIYFNSDLQARVLAMFHYSLRDVGILFLGRSESSAANEGLFNPLDRKSRIFVKRADAEERQLLPKVVRVNLLDAIDIPSRHRDKTWEQLFFSAIATNYSPPAVLVRSDFKILHSFGKVDDFMQFPVGAPEMNLAGLIIPELQNELITTMHKAKNKKTMCFSRKRRIPALEKSSYRLAVYPLGENRNEDTYLIAFEPSGKAEESTPEEKVAQSADRAVENELVATREHMQTLLEEMAASNEEMQALNEEVQASNEELQATNEELEASNEELQATNEELVSLNEEMLVRTSELAAVNADFESVYNTIDFPIMVFDSALFVKRMNGVAIRQFELPPVLAGQHFMTLKLPPYIQCLEQQITEVIRGQRKIVSNIDYQEKTFKIYITPTINHQGETQSVVLVIVDNTDLVQAKKQLEESREQLLSIMNNSLSVIFLKDTSGRYKFVNRRFEEFFDLKAEYVIGKTDSQIFSHDIADMFRKKDLDTMREMRDVESEEYLEFPLKSVWLTSVRFPIFDSSGTVVYICTQSVDTSGKRQAEEQLRLAAKVFDRSGEAISITDSTGVVITVNDAFSSITGYASSEVIGKKVSMLKSGKHTEEFYKDMWNHLVTEGWWQGEIFNKKKTGEIYPEWLTINAVQDASGKVLNYVAIFSDITAIKSSQKKIEYLATHDELTGLPNRALFIDRLKHSIAMASRSKQKIAVMFIDLDNFKNINDSLGHDIGDILLKEVADRLKQSVRDADTLARLGGDEFTVILNEATTEDITVIASRIIDYLSASYKIDEKDLYVSCSIGISVYPDDGTDSSALIKNADTAMYRAKESGRSQYQFFAEEMKMVAYQRMTYETGLRLAIENNERFYMKYQPQVDLRTGHLAGCEALLRWKDPHMGEVSPANFIPVAEKSGMIVPIGEIVVHKVLQQMSQWQKAGLQPLRTSINFSAHQLRDRKFIAWFDELLTQYSVSPDAITVELTESTLMEQLDEMKNVLFGLKDLGSRLSIDDFGTGYSSLAYLKKLPISEIKIDRTFVDGIVEDPDDRAIASAIMNISRALNLEVVAEGVENEQQLEVLKSNGCDIVQGYFFYKPISPEQIEALIK